MDELRNVRTAFALVRPRPGNSSSPFLPIRGAGGGGTLSSSSSSSWSLSGSQGRCQGHVGIPRDVAFAGGGFLIRRCFRLAAAADGVFVAGVPPPLHALNCRFQSSPKTTPSRGINEDTSVQIRGIRLQQPPHQPASSKSKFCCAQLQKTWQKDSQKGSLIWQLTVAERVC